MWTVNWHVIPKNGITQRFKKAYFYVRLRPRHLKQMTKKYTMLMRTNLCEAMYILQPSSIIGQYSIKALQFISVDSFLTFFFLKDKVRLHIVLRKAVGLQ